ncbi:MAG: hypothetical protein AMXMBFR4_13360 [Candidatus Hydrogenedentota bacterium]
MTRARRGGLFLRAAKWLPVLAFPFSVFFFEAWLQIQIFARDYESAVLKRKMREIDFQINRLQETADELQTLKRISAKAPDLGLAPVEPGQIEIVRASRPMGPAGDAALSTRPFLTVADAEMSDRSDRKSIPQGRRDGGP